MGTKEQQELCVVVDDTKSYLVYNGMHVSTQLKEAGMECSVDQNLEDEAGTRVHEIP